MKGAEITGWIFYFKMDRNDSVAIGGLGDMSSWNHIDRGVSSYLAVTSKAFPPDNSVAA